MPLFGISGSPQAVISTAPASWVEIQTLRGIGPNRTRLYVDTSGNLYGQFENNPPKLIAGLGSSSTAADNTVPIGAVFQWASGTAPTGYLLCDGGSFSAGAYPKLAAILGNTFGGVAKLPNFAGRVIVGAGQKDYQEAWPGALAVGSTGGSPTITLSQSNLPEHSHSIEEETGGEHTHEVTISSHSHTVSGTVAGHDHALSLYVSSPTDVDGDGTFIDLQHKHDVDDTEVDIGAGGTDEAVTTSSGGAHSHTVGVGNAGAHDHTITATATAVSGHTHGAEGLSVSQVSGQTVTIGAHSHSYDFTLTALDEDGGDTSYIDVEAEITGAGGHSHNLDGTTGSDDGHTHAKGTLGTDLEAGHNHGVSGDATIPAHSHTLDFHLGGENGEDSTTDFIELDGSVTLTAAGGHNHTTVEAGEHNHTWTEGSSTLAVSTAVAGLTATATNTLSIANTELTNAATTSTEVVSTLQRDGAASASDYKNLNQAIPDVLQTHAVNTYDWFYFGYNDAFAVYDYDSDSTPDVWGADVEDYSIEGDANHRHKITVPAMDISNTDHGHSLTGSVDVSLSEPGGGTGHSHSLTGAVLGSNTLGGEHTHAVDTVPAHTHPITATYDAEAKLTNKETSEEAATTGSLNISESDAGGHSHTITGSTASGGDHNHSLMGLSTESVGNHAHAIVLDDLHAVHSGTTGSAGGTDATIAAHDHTITGSTASGGGHTHTITASATEAGTHSHTGTTNGHEGHTHTVTLSAHDHTVDGMTGTSHDNSGEATTHLDHVHDIDGVTTESATSTFSGLSSEDEGETVTSSSAGANHSHGGRTGVAGVKSPDEIEVVQPWIAMNFIIKHD